MRLDQLVARQREEPALGGGADRVPGATDPLQQRRDRARRAELADQVDAADVDAELERGGGDQRAQLAGLEPALGLEALIARERPVVRGDGVLAEAVGEVLRHPLRQAGGC